MAQCGSAATLLIIENSFPSKVLSSSMSDVNHSRPCWWFLVSDTMFRDPSMSFCDSFVGVCVSPATNTRLAM